MVGEGFGPEVRDEVLMHIDAGGEGHVRTPGRRLLLASAIKVFGGASSYRSSLVERRYGHESLRARERSHCRIDWNTPIVSTTRANKSNVFAGLEGGAYVGGPVAPELNDV